MVQEQQQPAASQSKCATQVVFDSDRDGLPEIYILDVVSREVTRLTRRQDAGESSRFPDFAPGGDRIVFVSSNEQGAGHLFLVDSDGGNLHQLTSEEAIYEIPTWSPSGEWIAFVKSQQGAWGLYRIRPDGSDLERLGPEGLTRLLEKHKLDLYSFSVYRGGYPRYAELLGKVGGGVAVRGSGGFSDRDIGKDGLVSHTRVR